MNPHIRNLLNWFGYETDLVLHEVLAPISSLKGNLEKFISQSNTNGLKAGMQAEAMQRLADAHDNAAKEAAVVLTNLHALTGTTP